MIRLYIIDDHSVIVDGIRQRLRHQQEGITITGSSDNVEEFIQSVPADAFDIVILDLWLPDRDPLDNLNLIRNHFPLKPVVIYTQETSAYWIRVMMEGGARAYLMKNAERREFKETLEKVYLGKTISPVMLFTGNAIIPDDLLNQQKYFLKPSERLIAAQVSKGASLKSIATDRGTTVSAIEKTLKKIRKNFGVRNNPELIQVLINQKLI